jgi:hypothetical protein
MLCGARMGETTFPDPPPPLKAERSGGVQNAPMVIDLGIARHPQWNLCTF